MLPGLLIAAPFGVFSLTYSVSGSGGLQLQMTAAQANPGEESGFPPDSKYHLSADLLARGGVFCKPAFVWCFRDFRGLLDIYTGLRTTFWYDVASIRETAVLEMITGSTGIPLPFSSVLSLVYQYPAAAADIYLEGSEALLITIPRITAGSQSQVTARCRIDDKNDFFNLVAGGKFRSGVKITLNPREDQPVRLSYSLEQIFIEVTGHPFSLIPVDYGGFMVSVILLIIGFVLLIKGADFLVDGAAAIASKLKISRLVVGLTIVAFGTSMPELFVNLFATAENTPEIAIGNVLGSNIANILLILGISAIIYPLTVSRSTVWKEIPFSLLAVVMLGVLANDSFIDGAPESFLSRVEAMALLGFFILYLYYTFSIAREDDPLAGEVTIKELSLRKAVLLILAGLSGMAFGGKWIVDGAVRIAESLHISQSLIGLTIVALGTSLPELATSVVAAYKKNVEIAVGNVVGSNIFNIFFILGISGVVRPLPFAPLSNADILVVLAATLLLFLAMFTGKRSAIDRWEGVVFVSGYAGYIVYLIFR